MTIADAITNLHALVSTHLANVEPTVRVFDGQPVEDVAQEAVVIAMTAEELATDGLINDAGLYAFEENFDINCLIRVWSGDSDLPRLRSRAEGLYRVVRDQVQAHQTLNGAVTRARVASVQYSPMRIPDGTVVQMAFRVRCRTLTS
jgi:hypothetical protein